MSASTQENKIVKAWDKAFNLIPGPRFQKVLQEMSAQGFSSMNVETLEGEKGHIVRVGTVRRNSKFREVVFERFPDKKIKGAPIKFEVRGIASLC